MFFFVQFQKHHYENSTIQDFYTIQTMQIHYMTKMYCKTFLFLFIVTDSVKTSLILLCCRWSVKICYAVLLYINFVHKLP